MLKLGKLTDYAIVLLTYSAQAGPSKLVTARKLADRSKLPLPTVSKIMKSLSRAGILVSHRGVKGGYSLERAAAGISITEVIRAMEGPVVMTECCAAASPHLCDIEACCPVRANWQRINEVVLAALERVTVADMTVPEDCEEKTGTLLRLLAT